MLNPPLNVFRPTRSYFRYIKVMDFSLKLIQNILEINSEFIPLANLDFVKLIFKTTLELLV